MRAMLVLLLVTGISFWLRLYHLDTLPKILNRDEAALAYNAVLLGQTGSDEWGKPWPVALQSFGDYKLPGYVMILVAFFRFLPTEDWVVRLPAAIAGTSLIPVSYWLARKWRYSQSAALTLALMIAATPVFFFFSRIAFEAMVALILWVSLIGLIIANSSPHRFRWWVDLVAIVIAAAAVFTYNTPLLLLPFLLISLPLLRGITQWKKWIGLLIGLTVVFVATALTLLPLTSQKSGITFFSDETTMVQAIEYRQSLPAAWQSVVGSKYVYIGGLVLRNIAASFSPSFLVTNGGAHPWHTVPHFGHLGWVVYLLGLLGFGVLVFTISKQITAAFKTKKTGVNQLAQLIAAVSSKQSILLFWLMTSLAPAVITVDAPHATRSLPFFFWWLVVALEGGLALHQWLSKKAVKNPKLKKAYRLFWPTILLVIAAEFSWYTLNYFTSYYYQQPTDLKVGFDQAIRQAAAEYPEVPIAVVDDGGFLYISAAWYLDMPANEYFETIIRQQPNSIGFRYGEQLGQFHFIAQPQDQAKTNEPVLLNWNDNQWHVVTY